MTVFLGSDHRGYPLKEKIKAWLLSQKYDLVDCGNTVLDPTDDYPDFTFAVADKVVVTPDSYGIIFCGSGGGVTIASNKVRGVRAAQGVEIDDVTHNRDHNDINILTISADFTSVIKAQELVYTFLHTKFSAEPRCIRRLEKIRAREI